MYFKNRGHVEDVIKALDHTAILKNTIRALPIDNSFSTKTNLYIKGLDKACTVKQLEAFIRERLQRVDPKEKAEEVANGLYRAEIVQDCKDGMMVSRGYGFIQFRSDEAMKVFKNSIKEKEEKDKPTEVGNVTCYDFKSYNEREHISSSLVLYNLSSIPKESAVEQTHQVVERLREVFGEHFEKLELDRIKVCTTGMGKHIVVVGTKPDANKDLFKWAAEHPVRFDEFRGRSVRVCRSGIFDERGMLLHNLNGEV